MFHSIRATVISRLVREDVPDRLIRELAGHESGTVTFGAYSRVDRPSRLNAIKNLSIIPSY
ncbi:hypothetical protein [Pseudomonas extremaustralis]|uniref:hypothetical protein n=1 Tax=Pseudomonas extremaustralis TaxID=359110 RepID=UPI0038621115